LHPYSLLFCSSLALGFAGCGTGGSAATAGAGGGGGSAGSSGLSTGSNGSAGPGSSGSGASSSSGSFNECGAFVPGDALTVCTATYLGGSGADHVAALDIAPDASVVLGGTMSNVDFGVTPTALMGGGDGVVLRLTSTGRKVLSVTRLGAHVDDLEVDRSAGRIAVVGDFGAAVISTDAKSLLWRTDIGGAATRVAMGEGVVAALVGKAVHVLDATTGMELGTFAASGNAINDIAVDGAQKTVFVTGYKQDDGGPCSQYKSTFIRAYGYDGTKKWADYDWTHTDVGSSGDCADSQGLALGMGRDGKLYYAGKSDGGNTVHQKDPRDLAKNAPNVAFDAFNTPYGFKGAGALGYYARFDAATGLLEAGQFVLTRKAAAGEDPASKDANAAVPSAITADEQGNILVAGGAAYQIQDHDKKTINGVAVGAYAAYEAFALMVSPDLKKRLTWTVFTKAGPADATAVAAGKGIVAFGAVQSDTQLAKGGLLTADALQAQPGGGPSEGFLAVWPAP